ncbi:MAG: hypothetical protein AAF738_10045, partial [Bacteroidota bacterium]
CTSCIRVNIGLGKHSKRKKTSLRVAYDIKDRSLKRKDQGLLGLLAASKCAVFPSFEHILGHKDYLLPACESVSMRIEVF